MPSSCVKDFPIDHVVKDFLFLKSHYTGENCCILFGIGCRFCIFSQHNLDSSMSSKSFFVVDFLNFLFLLVLLQSICFLQYVFLSRLQTGSHLDSPPSYGLFVSIFDIFLPGCLGFQCVHIWSTYCRLQDGQHMYTLCICSFSWNA